MSFRFAIFVILMLLGPARAELTIAENGQSDYVICVPTNATPPQRRGADELQRYIEAMTSVKLPVITAPEPVPAKAIVITGTDDKLDASGDEGFRLRTEGQRLLIFGAGRRGAMYGCTTLLESMGVRWYTADVTRIPKLTRLNVPDIDKVFAPSFEYREPFFTEAFDRDWAARNRTNGSHAHLDDSTGGKLTYQPFVHSFNALIPRALYKDHPEYFPLIDGKRQDGDVQRCLSNPEVLALTIAKVREWIQAFPDARILTVSQNDAIKFCQCDTCTETANRFGGQQSGLYLWFVNQVAEAIEKDHPDKLIDTLAYQFTEAAPTGIVPRKNVRIRLCPIDCCVSHLFDQCTAKPNVLFVERLKAWSKLTDSLYIWHYNANFANYLMPFPDFRGFTSALKLYKRMGVKGIFFEGDYAPGGGGAESELRAWVMAQMLWNSELEADPLIDEWMDGVYGPAAKPMRAWFDLIHQPMQLPDAHLFIFHGKDAPHLTKEILAKGETLFAEAERLAKEDPVALRHIAKEKLCYRCAKLLVGELTDTEIELFAEDARAAGITQLKEALGIDEWVRKRRHGE
jgi:hypothetical protein